MQRYLIVSLGRRVWWIDVNGGVLKKEETTVGMGFLAGSPTSCERSTLTRRGSMAGTHVLS